MFQVGDRIAHPMHGAGIVREIVQQRVDGQDCNFYSVEMTTGSMRVLVPCDPCGGLVVRAILTPEEAQEVYAQAEADNQRRMDFFKALGQVMK